MKKIKQTIRSGYQMAILLFLTLVASMNAIGQLAPQYPLTISSGTYASISATGTSVASGDEVGTNITGFTGFTVNGVTYNNARMCSNGWLALYGASAPTATTNYLTLSTAMTNGAVIFAPFGRNLNINANSGTSWWQQVGNELVFEWKNYNRYGFTDVLNFQIRLNTSTGNVKFVYGTMTPSTNANVPQVGWKTNGTVAGNWATDINNVMIDVTGSPNACDWSNAVTGNANNSTCYFNSANAGVVPASGLTYTWTKPNGTDPNPVRTFSAVSGITASDATLTWAAPAGATQYNIRYRAIGSCTWTNFSGNPVSSATATLTGLTSETTYQIQVQSGNGTAWGLWSHIPNQAGTGNGYVAAGTFTTLALTCAGTPAPGNTVSSANPVCSGVNFNLSLQNLTFGTGVNYQWQSSTNGGLTWNNFGTSSASQTVSQTANTLYQCIVQCTNSGMQAGSTPVNVTTNPFSNCYCTPSGPGSSYYLSAMSATGLTAFSVTAAAPPSGGYMDRSSTDTVSQYLGSNVNFNLTVANGADGGMAIWVDFNQNGSFADAGEKVYNSGAYLTGASGTFSVPVTAALGNTEMRIGFNWSSTSPTECGPGNTYTDYEDFTFKVLMSCVSLPTAPVDASHFCQSATPTDLTWSAVSGADSYTVFLSAPNAPTLDSVATVATLNYTTAAPLATGVYQWMIVPKNSTGAASGCNVFTFTVDTLPTIAVSSTPASGIVCLGSSATLTASGASTYSWSPADDLDVTIGATVVSTPTVNRTYTVTGTDGNGCANTANFSLVADSFPVTVTAGSTTFCLGDATTLTASTDPGPSTLPSGYCTPTVGITGSTGDYIDNFSFNTIINNGSGDAPSDYTDYSGTMSTNVTTGSSYAISMQSGSSLNQGFNVWIDYNRDGVFDTSESVYNTGSASTGVFSGTITIPGSASLGTTKMRVGCLYAGVPASTEACEHTGYGEYEDYAVNIFGEASTYTWSGAAGLSGTTGSLVTATPTATGANTYYLTATNANGCTAMDSVTLNVNALPSIFTQPANTSVCEGSALNMSITTDATSIQWLQNGTAITGANSATYTVPSAAMTDAGSYTVALSNAAGCVDTSDAATVTVNALPSITTQPADTSVCEGSALDVSVVSDATGFQWLQDGTAISGANAATYSVAAAVATDAGSYTVALSNAAGCVDTSNAATVTVNALPSIFTQPANTSVCEGAALNMSITTDATSIQWLQDGNPISGANAATYSVAAAVASDAGSYTVALSNAAGCVDTSAVAVVSLNALPVITTQPADTSVCEGSGFAVSVVSDATSFQWLLNGTAISGANAATYSVATAGISDTGSYTVALSNAAGCLDTSAVAIVSLNARPTLTVTAMDNTSCSPNGMLHITATPALVDGDSYDVTYNGSTTVSGVVVASGELMISGLDSGAYNNINITSALTCTSDSVSTTVGGTNAAGNAFITPTTASENQSQPSGTVTYNNASCERIATINATNGDLGTVTTDVAVLGAVGTFNSEFYFGRVYDLSATNNVGGQVTLYFSDAEVADYDAAVGTSNPMFPQVAPGGSNIMITAFHSAPGSGNGPINYDTATSELITPISVVHNVNGYYEVTFNIGGFSGFFANTNNSAPLPVVMGDIKATNLGAVNRVDWDTKDEEAGDAFVIERSADARNFTTIGNMDAKGISNSRYSFIDAEPYTGINYYRLLLVNNDGTRYYSKVVNATVGGKGLQLEAFPNPVREVLTVRVNGKVTGNGEVSLLDASGRTLAKASIETNGTATFNMQHLAQGMYLVKFTDDATTQILKVTKD